MLAEKNDRREGENHGSKSSKTASQWKTASTSRQPAAGVGSLPPRLLSQRTHRYSVGFAKQNMVIFTTTGGMAQVTTFPKLVELAGITSSRLDASLARP